MLTTPEELQKFSGVYSDNEDMQNKYIESASEIIRGYVKYDPEQRDDWKKERIIAVYVYSVDGINFYEDEERTIPAVIPEGKEIFPTLIEHQYFYQQTEIYVDVPDIFSLVCLEIATLIQQEENQNIGINSKSFSESGSRTFLNVVNYDKYLARLSRYRKAKVY